MQISWYSALGTVPETKVCFSSSDLYYCNETIIFDKNNLGGMKSVFLMGCYDEDRDTWVTVTKVGKPLFTTE